MTDNHFTSPDEISGKDKLSTDDIPMLMDQIQSEPVNLLRRRTFNDDLKNLVHRIRDNEATGQSEETPPDSDIQVKHDEITILKNLHRLFYATRHMDSLLSAGVILNQKVRPADIFTSVTSSGDIMANIIKSLGYETSQLLIYRRDKRAFETFPVDSTRINSSSIGLHDSVFRNIIESPSGILLKENDFTSDQFMIKRFPFIKGDSSEFIYMNMTSRFTRETLNQKENFLSTALSPIILIHGTGLNQAETAESLYPYLHKHLALFLIVMLKTIGPFWDSPRLSSHYEMLEWLEFFLYLYRIRPDFRCLIIHLHESSSTEDLLMMRYLFTRIGKVITEESSMIRYSRDALIIFLPEKTLGSVETVVHEYRSIFKGAFHLELLETSDETFISLIHKLQRNPKKS